MWQRNSTVTAVRSRFTATWTGISGDHFHGRFTGADLNLVSNPWLDEHIRSKGPLGKQYPHMDYLMEGAHALPTRHRDHSLVHLLIQRSSASNRPVVSD